MQKLKVFRALIMGAPGSGKGTIAERIISRFNFKYASTGDILRSNVRMNTPLGIEAQKYISNGELVPDDLVMKCVLNRVNAIGNDSWLLDGFPRTIAQAEYLWKFQPVESVIKLDVPHDVIVERVQRRWIHVASGRVYNLDFNQPLVDGKDDITGEDLEQREDDQPETVLKRLALYEECIKPMADFYRKLNILVEFEGRTTDEIWPSVEEYLEKSMK